MKKLYKCSQKGGKSTRVNGGWSSNAGRAEVDLGAICYCARGGKKIDDKSCKWSC